MGLRALLLLLACAAAYGARRPATKPPASKPPAPFPASCPAPATRNISCYVGSTFSVPGMTGFCYCACGSTKSTATSWTGDILTPGYSMPYAYNVPNKASCLKAGCIKNYPALCKASGYVNASNFTLFKDQWEGPINGPFPTPAGFSSGAKNGSICQTVTFVMSPKIERYFDNGGYPDSLYGYTPIRWLDNAIWTFYGYYSATRISLGNQNVAEDCEMERKLYKNTALDNPGALELKYCSTNLCNAPPRAQG